MYIPLIWYIPNLCLHGIFYPVQFRLPARRIRKFMPSGVGVHHGRNDRHQRQPEVAVLLVLSRRHQRLPKHTKQVIGTCVIIMVFNLPVSYWRLKVFKDCTQTNSTACRNFCSNMYSYVEILPRWLKCTCMLFARTTLQPLVLHLHHTHI